MDSGAFTAWKSGKPIALKPYIEFLKANAEWITHSVALDVILPGDPEAAAAQGYANYMAMRKAGLRPIPVFHVGESVDWLKRLLDAGADYIGLAALSMTRRHMDRFYDLVWSDLVNGDGLPLIKAHAFGEARLGTLLRHPWQSSDSTSWIYKAMKVGIVPIDGIRTMSHRKDGLSSRTLQDVGALAGLDQGVWDGLLRKARISPAAFADRGALGYAARTYMTARYYNELGAKVTAKAPARFHGGGLRHQPMMTTPPISIPTFNKYLVIGANPLAATIAYMAGTRHVLVSYAHLQAAKDLAIVRRFCLDPMSVIQTSTPHKRQYDLLKGHIEC